MDGAVIGGAAMDGAAAGGAAAAIKCFAKTGVDIAGGVGRRNVSSAI